jgi:hypothetical protein
LQTWNCVVILTSVTLQETNDIVRNGVLAVQEFVEGEFYVLTEMTKAEQRLMEMKDNDK